MVTGSSICQLVAGTGTRLPSLGVPVCETTLLTRNQMIAIALVFLAQREVCDRWRPRSESAIPWSVADEQVNVAPSRFSASLSRRRTGNGP
jgi:hypothetical protein